MKTPISYYGGKQTMLKHILPLVPQLVEHDPIYLHRVNSPDILIARDIVGKILGEVLGAFRLYHSIPYL